MLSRQKISQHPAHRMVKIDRFDLMAEQNEKNQFKFEKLRDISEYSGFRAVHFILNCSSYVRKQPTLAKFAH